MRGQRDDVSRNDWLQLFGKRPFGPEYDNGGFHFVIIRLRSQLYNAIFHRHARWMCPKQDTNTGDVFFLVRFIDSLVTRAINPAQ